MTAPDAPDAVARVAEAIRSEALHLTCEECLHEAARAARRAALEEAARDCEAFAEELSVTCSGVWVPWNVPRECAARLRALAGKEGT